MYIFLDKVRLLILKYKAMENITSRKNRIISHLRSVASDSAYRKECGEFICDGEKTLREAIFFGAELVCVLWKDKAGDTQLPEGVCQYTAPADLFEYASPLKSSPGPVFTVKMPARKREADISCAVVLENLQDPGNVGTVIRTANAFNIDAVILVGSCADLYNPKTVRASMGAIFRQRVMEMSIAEMKDYLTECGLTLYGAALSDKAKDMREVSVKNCAVAIGSEGRGLSAAFLNICDGELIIPMNPDSESLNAAVAASVFMWEMSK